MDRLNGIYNEQYDLSRLKQQLQERLKNKGNEASRRTLFCRGNVTRNRNSNVNLVNSTVCPHPVQK